MIVARQLAASLTHKQRGYLFATLAAELFGGVLVTRQGKQRDVYAIAESEPDAALWRVFIVNKVKTGELYKCSVSCVEGEIGHCTCFGFSRWKNCKHQETLADLVQFHNLPSLV